MRFFLTIMLGLIGGCAAHLPVYGPMSDEAALATIAGRQSQIRTVSAEGDLTLIEANGERVSLDAALVARMPDKVRLRAWKFGRAVFDLTVIGDQAWVVAPEDGPREFDIGASPARNVSDALDLLGPEYFQAATVSGGDLRTLVCRGPALGRDDVVCEIDRRTLTPRGFVVGDETGYELLMNEYIAVGDLVWPVRMVLRSPSGEIRLRLRGVTLNEDVSAGAFAPPRRAKPLP